MQKFKVIIIIAAIMTGMVGWASDEEPVKTQRTFSDKQGRTIQGFIIAFEPAEQAVTIERSDGKTGVMKIDLLTDEDQAFIRSWAFDRAFLEELTIVPQLVSVPISSQSTKYTDVSKQVLEFYYDITLENTSNIDFGKTQIEYCLFYRQGTRSGTTINYDEGICYGLVKWKTFKAAEKTTLQSKKIKLYSEAGTATMFGQAEFSDANVRGLWIRVTTTAASGEKMVRDFRTSDDPMCKWTPGTVGAGMNGSDSPYRIIVAP